MIALGVDDFSVPPHTSSNNRMLIQSTKSQDMELPTATDALDATCLRRVTGLERIHDYESAELLLMLNKLPYVQERSGGDIV